MSDFFYQTPNGLEIFLRVAPKSSANRIGAVAKMDHLRLKVQVTTVPEDGKANAAVIKLLSKHWKIAKSLFTVTSGVTNRNKTLLISGDGVALTAKIKENT